MYCKNCDKEFGKEYVVCPECGEILRESSSNNMTFDNDTDREHINNVNDSRIVEDKSVMYIILSIAMLLCCNQICGIVSLIFSIMGSSAFGKGYYDDALQKWKVSKITLWVGVILSIVIVIGTILLFGVGVATTISNTIN